MFYMTDAASQQVASYLTDRWRLTFKFMSSFTKKFKNDVFNIFQSPSSTSLTKFLLAQNHLIFLDSR